MPTNNSKIRKAERRKDAEARQAAYAALTDEEKAAREDAWREANR